MHFTLSRSKGDSGSKGQKFTFWPLFLAIGLPSHSSGLACLLSLCDSWMHRAPGSTGGAESLSFILFQSLVVMALFWAAEAVSLNLFRLRGGVSLLA